MIEAYDLNVTYSVSHLATRAPAPAVTGPVWLRWPDPSGGSTRLQVRQTRVTGGALRDLILVVGSYSAFAPPRLARPSVVNSYWKRSIRVFSSGRDRYRSEESNLVDIEVDFGSLADYRHDFLAKPSSVA